MSILVVAEHRDGRLQEQTLEAITKGRELSGVGGGSLKVALLGKHVEPLASELAGYPVDEVLMVRSDTLEDYSPEGYSAALGALLEAEEATVVLTSHTATGYEFLPRVAGDLGRPVVTDVVEVGMDGPTLLVTRMGYNGKVALELAVETPAFVTLRPGSAKAAQKTGKEASVRAVDMELDSSKVSRRVEGYEKPETGDVDIAEADVVVTAGRGIKEQENLKLMEDLAKALGGVLAGSRPLIDKGWLPWSRQVGSSGKTVRPKIYVACGISGAMQHVTGMKGAGTIIAINIDPTAPIFAVAHYGVVGDLFKVVPALIKELESS